MNLSPKAKTTSLLFFLWSQKKGSAVFHVVDYSVHLCGLGCNDTASAAKLIILYEILCVCVCVCMQACVCACVMNQKWAFCWGSLEEKFLLRRKKTT